MAFAVEWENTYRRNEQISIWPWTDLIVLVLKYTNIKNVKTNNEKFKVLELGCGAGANISFFKALGVEYYAIEGSKTIVENLHKNFPEYKKNIIVGDFTKKIDFNEEFDLVFDRAALTHNKTLDIEKTLNIVFSKLKSGGKYIGIDWFSTKYDRYQFGEFVDKYTKKYEDGNFGGLGNVHFSDKDHLLDFFSKFQIELLEEKVVTKTIPCDQVRATWNFVFSK